jgi:hypothetical protein
MDRPKVALELSRAEAIVFVEFLMRYRDDDRLAIEHTAESQLLYDLCCMIESQLPELFDPAWRAIVGLSRDEVVAGPE